MDSLAVPISLPFDADLRSDRARFVVPDFLLGESEVFHSVNFQSYIAAGRHFVFSKGGHWFQCAVCHAQHTTNRFRLVQEVENHDYEICPRCFVTFFPNQEMRMAGDNAVLLVKLSDSPQICNGCGVVLAHPDSILSVLGYVEGTNFCLACDWRASYVDDHWQPLFSFREARFMRGETFRQLPTNAPRQACLCGKDARWVTRGLVWYCEECLENYRIFQVLAS